MLACQHLGPGSNPLSIGGWNIQGIYHVSLLSDILIYPVSNKCDWVGIYYFPVIIGVDE